MNKSKSFPVKWQIIAARTGGTFRPISVSWIVAVGEFGGEAAGPAGGKLASANISRRGSFGNPKRASPGCRCSRRPQHGCPVEIELLGGRPAVDSFGPVGRVTR
ncbi:hypothetical protein GCM10011588_29420 [Nocardia jinanensis]|uniref:Uncharacterized protein n=1 Tax=Nocardia jinanensis TaxID=382504 RepID=A0A917VS35_9NOCA|nr:hypothetical protein GCM10011588_29420 [Nocardia jinanensis]